MCMREYAAKNQKEPVGNMKLVKKILKENNFS